MQDHELFADVRQHDVRLPMPNPDPIDAIVIEQATNTGWTINGVPTVTGVPDRRISWTILETTQSPAANTLEYCTALRRVQFQQTTFNRKCTRATARSPRPHPPIRRVIRTCSARVRQRRSKMPLAPGGIATINFTLNNTTTGTQTFYVYAHGANGGGWSAPKVVTVTSSIEDGECETLLGCAGSNRRELFDDVKRVPPTPSPPFRSHQTALSTK